MIPEFKVINDVFIPKKIILSELTSERIDSLRESVIDFCDRCDGPIQSMHVWAYISKIIRGQEEAELWWVLDENKVKMFWVSKLFPDYEGKWVAQIIFGWSVLKNTRSLVKEIINDYFHKGVLKISFMTYRNPKVYQRWLGKEWKPCGTIFELRR